MEIFVSAGEASSDIHGAHVLRELKKLAGGEGVELRSFGLGGDRLAAEGVELMMRNREFSVGGGPVEILSKLPRRSRLERALERRLFEGPPLRGALLIDSGEINLRLASLLHFFGVPVVYFIPPKVWVWRHSRIEKIEQHVDLVLSILPFEEPIYRHWEIPFEYVGNPLADEIDFGLSEAEAKSRLGIDPERRVLTVLAGSRHNEVRYHAKPFGQGIRRLADELEKSGEAAPLVLLPAAQAIEPAQLEKDFGAELAGSDLELKVVKGQSHECLKAARAALVKSGTSTLEAALLGVPMVLAYDSSASTAWIYRNVVRYRGFVGMVNLFLEKDAESALGWGKPVEPVVPELILNKCTPDNIARELAKVWREGAEREQMLKRLAETRELVRPRNTNETSPVGMAARASFRIFKGEGARA